MYKINVLLNGIITIQAGIAALHIAAQSGYIQAVEVLINHGAKLDILDKVSWI